MTKNAPIADAKRDHQEAHDEWIRSEVQKTLDGLRDGSVKLISEEEHDRRWREKRATLPTSSGKSD